jgi:hypothetical protein
MTSRTYYVSLAEWINRLMPEAIVEDVKQFNWLPFAK